MTASDFPGVFRVAHATIVGEVGTTSRTVGTVLLPPHRALLHSVAPYFRPKHVTVSDYFMSP